VTGLLVILGTLAPAALAQAGADEREAAIRAALTAVVRQMEESGSLASGASLAITPDYILRPRGRRVSTGPALGGEMTRALVDSFQAEVRRIESVKSCETRFPDSCRLNGVGALLSFTEPEEGDGWTSVFVRVVYANPESTRQPVSTEVRRVRLERTDAGAWSVSEMTTVLIS
jgi:hypothetical protein